MAEDRGPQLLGVNIALFVVAAGVVFLRCFTRAHISKVFGADDWLMVISLVRFWVVLLFCTSLQTLDSVPWIYHMLQ